MTLSDRITPSLFVAIFLCLVLTSGSIRAQQPVASPAREEADVVRKMLQSDVAKAEQIVFAQANLRINFENDTELEYALLHVRNAQTSADVHNVFQSAKDNVDEEIGYDTSVALFKAGAALFGANGASVLIDGGSWLANQAQQADNKIQFSAVPPVYASAILLGGIQNASPETKEAIAREIAAHLGKDFDQTVDAVTQNRILEDPNKGATGGQFVDRQLYDKQVDIINNGLNEVKNILDRQIAEQKAEAQKRSSASDLALDTAHYKAGVELTGLILGPIVGTEAARKITTVGNNFIQMNTAIKQFGPGGLTPDKLLMFTNFATAGVAIVGMIVASQQEDPTMAALKQIMQQLQAIKEQLERIEKKIDDLSDLVLVGFERTLTDLQGLNVEFANFQRAVLGRIVDQRQRDAATIFLNYVSSDPQHYKLALQCDQPVKVATDQSCLNDFASLLSDYTIFTGINLPRVPDIVSPVWSNELLTPKALTKGGDYSLTLEQLSYPLFLADDPSVFLSMIAYNQSAASSYSSAIMGSPLIPNLANPEILDTALLALVDTFGVRPSMRSEDARPLVEQAIKRVNDTETMLATTVGSVETMHSLWKAMADDIEGYQEKVNAILSDLKNSEYTEDKYRFNGGKLGTIAPCPTMHGFPPLQSPLDPMTKQRMDKFVDPLFWAAQEMHLGRIAQCYEITATPVSIGYGNLQFFQAIGRVRIFFNRTPEVDSTKISQWELSDAATSFSDASLPIATMTYTTKRHYTLYFGTGLGVLSHAWGSPPLNVHDVYECYRIPPRGLDMYVDNCKAGPDDDSPVQALVIKSTDEDGAKGSQTKSTIEELVHNALIAVVSNRSEVWNYHILDFSASPDPKILLNRDVVTKPILSDALKAYTLKYLLADNLLLVSMYHQNPVASCLGVLSNYSPDNIVKMAADRVMQQDLKLHDEFLSAMSTVNSQCLGHVVNPKLNELKNQLLKLQ